MSRLQLALNVADIDAAVEFYSTLFDTEPAKRRPGYANFAVDNPPLKLVLFENPEATGTLNHLGVERESMEEVEAQANRLEAAGLTLDTEGDVVCCYARQDKHWVTGPDGQRWENYVVLADAGAELEGKSTADVAVGDQASAATEPVKTGDGGCCGGSGNTSTTEGQPAVVPDGGAGACCTG
ncbi:ArsI/CadI family heavy metal resistance metalloenzyme [Actinopolymorpha sp. NPDC004070]|uniref:ArsI/CadI family heavy metal resistance metalloenzyme n=1 Tax=Actinopolymorpha sp. NPDC004070 TaxID=3154548 RepID=UPI0033AA9189